MKNFNTVVLERMAVFTESFQTEPYECGWAGEAIFFIRIHEMEGKAVRINSRVQISVDGIEWIDEGAVFPEIEGPGNYALKVGHFGGWLRLSTEIDGKDPSVKTTVHLSLKE